MTNDVVMKFRSRTLWKHYGHDIIGYKEKWAINDIEGQGNIYTNWKTAHHTFIPFVSLPCVSKDKNLSVCSPPPHRALEEGQFRKKNFAFESFFLDTNWKFRYIGSCKSAFSPSFCEIFTDFWYFLGENVQNSHVWGIFENCQFFHTKSCLKT